MCFGSTPAVAPPQNLANGFSENFLTIFSEAIIRHAAPSFTPEAFPAVTVPFSLKGVGKRFNFSTVVLRGCSSWSNVIFSLLLFEISMPIISSLKRLFSREF